MTSYDSFLDNVMPDLPGCTYELAINAIRNAAIEFCEKTLILQADHDPVTVVAGITDYDFAPPSGSLVVKVMQAWYKKRHLKPLAPDEIRRPEVYNRAFVGADVGRTEPTYILQKSSETFSVYPVPAEKATSAITMRVAYKPTRNSTQCDELLFQDYAEGIAHGAKARLMMSPAKPYTNPQLAAAEMQLFQQAINVARQRANRGYVRSDLQVEFPRI